jgi:hypothetical protein
VRYIHGCKLAEEHKRYATVLNIDYTGIILWVNIATTALIDYCGEHKGKGILSTVRGELV